MKKISTLVFLGFLFLFPLFAQPQPADRFFEQFLDRDRKSQKLLEIHELEMTPDPVREGYPIGFSATISNLTRFPGSVSLSIKEKGVLVTEVRNVIIQPGNNRVVFPETRYRFHRREHCLTVEVDIERTRDPIDLAKEFCVKRTHMGWSLTGVRLGPFYVEHLEIYPDPIRSGQDVQFRVRFRNDGNPVRANLQILDKDQIVVRLMNANLLSGVLDLSFPSIRYPFQRSDHCFIVTMEVEGTPQQVDMVKEFCAQRTYMGWSLNRPRIGPLRVEDLDISPDPVLPNQDIRFRVRLRNDGRPIRANIQIQDKDQVITRLNNVSLVSGISDFNFPIARYKFQRFDHCFIVFVDIEGTLYQVDVAREFCAKPTGWTLRP